MDVGVDSFQQGVLVEEKRPCLTDRPRRRITNERPRRTTRVTSRLCVTNARQRTEDLHRRQTFMGPIARFAACTSFPRAGERSAGGYPHEWEQVHSEPVYPETQR
jgi:hypothetical protein